MTHKDPLGRSEPVVLARSIVDLAEKIPVKLDPKVAQINRYSRDPKGIDITSLVQDKSILRYATWFEKYQRILMSDRRLKLAHENGLSWHKARQ